MVVERARAEERVLLAADTDFAMLLARHHAERPEPDADREDARGQVRAALALLEDLRAAERTHALAIEQDARTA